MFKTISISSLLALLAVSVLPTAWAQETSTAYVVHGIPGQDFGLEPALPVDIEVAGLGCAITAFSFGDRVGPLSVPAGEYDITISLADEMQPCGGAAVISLENVPLVAGANSTIIAHRTADGTTGSGDLLQLGITATQFPNDFTATGRGKARLIAQHTALAPAVDVAVSRNYSNPQAPGVRLPDFSNPTSSADVVVSQIKAELRPGAWDVALELAGAPVFGPDTLNLKPFKAYYVYAVGDFFTGSFQYLVFVEDGLKPSAKAGRAVDNTPKSSRRARTK